MAESDVAGRRGGAKPGGRQVRSGVAGPGSAGGLPAGRGAGGMPGFIVWVWGLFGFGFFFCQSPVPPPPRRYRTSWACGRCFIGVKVQVFAPIQGSVSGPHSVKHGLSAAAVPPARGKRGITLALSPDGQHLLCVLATWY